MPSYHKASSNPLALLQRQKSRWSALSKALHRDLSRRPGTSRYLLGCSTWPNSPMLHRMRGSTGISDFPASGYETGYDPDVSACCTKEEAIEPTALIMTNPLPGSREWGGTWWEPKSSETAISRMPVVQEEWSGREQFPLVPKWSSMAHTYKLWQVKRNTWKSLCVGSSNSVCLRFVSDTAVYV